MTKKLLMTASVFSHIESFHLPYIRKLAEAGWEVDIACGGALKELPFAHKLISVPLEKKLLSTANLRAMKQLRRLMKTEGYERVITHTSLAAFYTRAALFGLKRRPKAINVVHGYLFDDKTNALKRLLLELAELICAPVTDRVLTMNQYDFKWARAQKVGKELALIPGMGLDESKPCAQANAVPRFEDGTVRLIFPAEFSKRKNQKMLIRAMTALPKNVMLILPGRGLLLEECKRLSSSLGLEARVLFPGFVSDIVPWLMASDIAVSSSRYEGLPFNLMEAMHCALPIVASDVKGNQDLIQQGANGYLFAYDDEQGFANIVKMLLTDSRLCKELGEAGKRHVERYMLDNVIDTVLNEYLR